MTTLTQGSRGADVRRLQEALNRKLQPTPTQCWAACTAMITRSNVQAVVARTPADLIADDGGLRTFPDADDAMTANALFASAHGLTVRPPAPWSIRGLRAALQHGPLMLDLRWSAKGYAAGIGSPGHMILIAGIRGDNDPSGRGTTLRVFDPWPPTKGARCSVNYAKWSPLVSETTCRVFLLP